MRYPILFGSGMFFVFLLSSCEQSREWELDTIEEARLVVEAILTDEFQQQEVLLSQTFSDLNGTAPAISDATIEVTVSGVVYPFSPDPQQAGRYLSEEPFHVISGLDYTLTVDWNGEEYSAISRLSDVLPIPEPVFRQIGTTDSLELGNFIPPFSPFQQAMYRIDIDWAHIIDTAEVNRARLYLYTFSSLDMSQLVPPGRESVFFPKGSIVQIKKFGLTEDFAEYLRAKAIETDWNGAFFFSVSDNLPTNISNGGLGYFSTCAVLEETLIAN
jgi:hypothetical protein